MTALAMRAGFLAGVLLPKISAESAIVLDLESGKELLSKDADTRVYPASLTKLMTALILADTRSNRRRSNRPATALNRYC